MHLPEMTWVRTQVREETKDWYKETARLLGWNVPGVESAGLAVVSLLFTPQEFAVHIHRMVEGGEPEVESEETPIEEEV